MCKECLKLGSKMSCKLETFRKEKTRKTEKKFSGRHGKEKNLKDREEVVRKAWKGENLKDREFFRKNEKEKS